MKKVIIVVLFITFLFIVNFSNYNVKALSPYDTVKLESCNIKEFFNYEKFENYIGLENCKYFYETESKTDPSWVTKDEENIVKTYKGKKYVVHRERKYRFIYVIEDLGDKISYSTSSVFHVYGFDSQTLTINNTSATEDEITYAIGQDIQNDIALGTSGIELNIDAEVSYIGGISSSSGSSNARYSTVGKDDDTGYYRLEVYRKLANCKVVTLTVSEVKLKNKSNSYDYEYIFEYNRRPDEEAATVILCTTVDRGYNEEQFGYESWS